jgi:Leucine-rich repeat (LRR) protein
LIFPRFTLQANVEALKTLLSSIRLASTGNELPASIKSTSVNVVEKLQRPTLQLIITQAIDYPTLKGFPSTLEKLTINSSHLRTPVDRRIFTLKSLHTLDLSDNTITELPSKIQMNHLHTLIIRSNQLKSFPNDIQCPLLKHLDLSQNQLDKLDLSILHLSTLERLNLSSNQIKFIPRQILRLLPQLQVFNIASNQIRAIPSCLAGSGTRLHTFHYSENPLITEKCITYRRFNITLVELALRTVIKHR